MIEIIDQVYGDPVETANFEGLDLNHHRIVQSAIDTELIIREERAYGQGDTREEYVEHIRQRYAVNAKVIRQLHDEYGFHSPGYIVINDDQLILDKGLTYVATNKIHGQYFLYEHFQDIFHGTPNFHNVPETVAVQALSNIFRYYRDVVSGKVTKYMGDLRLGNLIYGRMQGDYEDHLYMYDLENRFLSIDGPGEGYANVSGLLKSSGERGRHIQPELEMMKDAYNNDFDELQEELDDLHAAAYAKQQEWLESRPVFN